MADAPGRAGGERASPSDRLWEDWDTPLRVPSAPEFHLGGFDGPLDLLLDLVQRQRLDLRRFSPLVMVEQFIVAMDRFADHVPLERRADWLVMAARLLLLRSRLCFPADAEEQAEAEREAERARNRVEELHAIRAAAAWLNARPMLGRDIFIRPQGPNPRVTSYMGLMEACLAVLSQEEAGSGTPAEVATSYRIEPTRALRVSDAITAIGYPEAVEQEVRFEAVPG